MRPDIIITSKFCITQQHLLPFTLGRGFSCGSASKESACNVGGLGFIPGWEEPYSREGRIAESTDTATPAPTSEKNKDSYSDLLY